MLGTYAHTHTPRTHDVYVHIIYLTTIYYNMPTTIRIMDVYVCVVCRNSKSPSYYIEKAKLLWRQGNLHEGLLELQVCLYDWMDGWMMDGWMMDGWDVCIYVYVIGCRMSSARSLRG